MLALSNHQQLQYPVLAPRSGLLDIGYVAAGYLIVYFGMRWLELPKAGSFAVLIGLGIATWRLRVQGQSWPLLGLSRPRSWARALLAVVALYAAVIAGMLLIVEPLAHGLGWRPLDLSTFANLRGNSIELAKMLLIAWTTAAIGEELLFRGFLLARLETSLGDRRMFTALAVVLQAALFGVAHAYLGPRGMASAALVGLIYGTWFMLRGRNLWPLIIAHGLTDTVSLFAIYAGALR